MRNLEWLSRWFTLNKLAIPLTSSYLIDLDYSDPLVSDIEITKSPLYSFSFSPIFATSNLFYYKSHRPKTTWRSWKVCLTVVTTSLKSRYQILRGVLCCGPDIVDHCWISIKRFNNPDGPAQLLKTSQVSLIVWVAATCFLPFRQYIIVWPMLKSSEYLENVMKPDKSISSWSLSN